MEDPKIYISGYCKIYHEDGKHHEINQRPLSEALDIITDDWIASGNCCDQTIIDMRDALKHQSRENTNV